MKAKITALTLAAASAFAFAPKPASANDGTAIVGGLIGGLIIGSAIAADHHDTVIVHDNNYVDGYWNTVAVNVWVPSCWVVERDYYGRSVRRYVTGHYERRNDRVWVRYDRHDRRDYGHGREIGRAPDRHDDRHDRNDRDHRDHRNDNDDHRDHR